LEEDWFPGNRALKIETSQFGTIQIAEDKIITMPASMPGFPGRRRFIILEREEARPFYWYQCLDDPDLALVIMNPYLFKPDYLVDLKPALREMSWEADGEDSLKLYVVVNASEGVPEKVTANLIGPLVINTRKREAVQIVIHDSCYSHRYPILRQKSNS
jgi:flagellar assembly factor FliW